MVGNIGLMTEQPTAPPLSLLSVVIPARDEEGCIASTVEHLHVELRLHQVPHEIIVVTMAAIPITWRNRRHGIAKLRIKEMGSRHFFICLYVWLEKDFSRGDYRKL